VFENLSDRILGSIKKLKGQARITESNIEEAIKEIRLSLLEADVNFKVVKAFIDRVKIKALGVEVLKDINPGQMFVKIVHDELVSILGGGSPELHLKKDRNVILLAGLQGAGKTTTSAKLALYIRNKLNRKPGMVSVDIYRPAAMDQLVTLAKQNNIPYFAGTPQQKPKQILEEALVWAKDNMIEVLIIDTAGRMQIDDQLMAELTDIKSMVDPQEILLVADAMLGQQSVEVAQGFHQKVGLTGLILTKVDGDARGGAALSIREVIGVPIKFLGIGEKVAALELFHPDRLAGRILDMGDVLSLVEKAKEVIDDQQAQASVEKMMKNQFSLNDFLSQIQQLKKLGGIESLLKFLPGMGDISKQMKQMAPPDAEMKKIEAIIHSMTLKERRNHKILNASRRIRIAQGSGTQVQDVNRLIKQFEQTQKMMSGIMKRGLFFK